MSWFIIIVLLHYFRLSDCVDCQIKHFSEINENCTVVTGDIAINGTTKFTFAQLSEKLSHIETVYGRVVLIQTPFQNFSFLSSLREIHYEPDTDQMTRYEQQALRIETNHLLETLGMPNLTTIVLKALVEDERFFATSIFDNPLLCLQVSQVENSQLVGRVYIPPMIYCGIKIIEKTKLTKKYTVENSNKVYCSMPWFNTTMPLGCQVLDAGVWIASFTNQSELDYFAIAMETVEYIMGPIVIKNTAIKTLNLPNLKTIYNLLYDKNLNTGWDYQVIQISSNLLLTEVNFPKLERIVHYGYAPFIKLFNNPSLKCSPDLCEKMLSLPRFELDSCSCGLIPNFNEGYDKKSFIITILESILCAIITLLLYGNVMLNVYKSGFSVSYFQFSILIYFILCCMEAVYNVFNNIKGSKYAYGLYLINWATIIVAITTSIFLLFYLRKYFSTYSQLQKHQRKLSIAFFLQALLSFVFCGFPEGVIPIEEDRIAVNRFLRAKKIFEYNYGSIIIRWHYIAYAIILRFFLHEMLAKIDIRSDTIVTTRGTKATARVNPAKPIQGIQ